MGTRMMPAEKLRAIAALIDAGKISDVAVVAIMDGQVISDFGIPPENPDRLVEALKGIIGWVDNKQANEQMRIDLEA